VRGQGAGAGCGGRVRGQEDVCAFKQILELKRGREGTLQHGPGAILEGAIGVATGDFGSGRMPTDM